MQNAKKYIVIREEDNKIISREMCDSYAEAEFFIRDNFFGITKIDDTHFSNAAGYIYTIVLLNYVPYKEEKMKYKVGDKVRIRKTLQEWTKYGSWTICNTIDERKPFFGKICTIADIVGSTYYLKETDNLHWTDEMFCNRKVR